MDEPGAGKSDIGIPPSCRISCKAIPKRTDVAEQTARGRGEMAVESWDKGQSIVDSEIQRPPAAHSPPRASAADATGPLASET